MAEAIAPAAEVEEDQANYAAIWKAALALYIDDCQTALHGKAPKLAGDKEEGHEALADLLTSQVQLARLCDVLGLDVDWIAPRIMAHIEHPPTRKR